MVLVGQLGHPVRRQIFVRLAQGAATVTDIAEPFEMSLNAISKHLKVLERAGLVSRSRRAQSRPCQLRADALTQISNWVDHTRQAWEARFDRLDTYVQQFQSQRTSIRNTDKENDRGRE